MSTLSGLSTRMALLRNRVRMLNYQRLHRRRLRSKPKKTKYGFSFAGHGLFMTDNWEQADQRTISRLLSRTDLFINVGANIGFYCCLAQNMDVKTIAFEPDQMNCELFIRNMKINDFGDNIVLNPVAVGDTFGFAEVYGMWTTVSLVQGFCDGLDVPRTVPTVKLDDAILGSSWLSGRVLVLIDVEGWEQNVLNGAGRMLALDNRPVWIIEVFPPGTVPGSREDSHLTIFDTMHKSGYRSYHIDADGEFPEIVNGAELLSLPPRDTNHNYLFIDKEADISDVV